MNPLLSGKKKSLLALIGNIDSEPMKASKDSMEMPSNEDDSADAMKAGQADAEKAAAKLLLVAIENKNPMAMVKAFKDLMDVCDSMDSESEMEG